MTKSTKGTKASTDTTNVIEIESPKWNSKYEKCTECGTTDLKHYSGGSCTRCYTEKRNEKLGLGKYNKETQERKLERTNARIEKLENELKELKAQKKELSKISA